MSERANLGLATTRELLEEVRARIECGNGCCLNYSTVTGERHQCERNGAAPTVPMTDRTRLSIALADMESRLRANSTAAVGDLYVTIFALYDMRPTPPPATGTDKPRIYMDYRCTVGRHDKCKSHGCNCQCHDAPAAAVCARCKGGRVVECPASGCEPTPHFMPCPACAGTGSAR